MVNSPALFTIRHLVYDQPGHVDRVRVLCVDEHKRKHIRGQGDPSFVTEIVDLTPVADISALDRLLGVVSDRSAAAFAVWLGACDQSLRDRVKVVSLDGFAGDHSAAKDVLPPFRTVEGPFQLVHLAAEKLTVSRSGFSG